MFPAASASLSFAINETKQADLLAPELFVVALFGNTPDESVRDFIGKDWAFANLDEQLAAMRGFVASFPSSPATKVFRDSLERRISAGLARFEEGGPYSDFLAIRRFSELARQAFPGDAPLQALDDRVTDRIKFIADRPKLLRSLAALGRLGYAARKISGVRALRILLPRNAGFASGGVGGEHPHACPPRPRV